MPITVTPSGSITLCKTSLEKDYKDTFTFSSLANQTSYFNNLTGNKSYTDYTYMKKDGKIRIAEPIDNIISYNYCFYVNTGFTTKRYYCFITRMEYVNENCTDVYIETDVFQTWYFQITWNRCFVEREHVNNDSVGANTYPENLELGEYIGCDLQPTGTTQMTCCFVIAVSELLFSVYSTTNEKVPSGLYYIGVRTLQDVRTITKFYDSQSKGDAIYAVFSAPEAFFSSFTNVNVGTSTVNMSTTVTFDLSPGNITVTKVNYLGQTYYPRNKKLLTFPYSFLQVSNNNGSVVNYYWEEFNKLVINNTVETNITFVLNGVLTPGCAFQAYPYNYKNILYNYDESISLGKFPIGGWNTDVYTNWLTSNCFNIASAITSDVGNIVLGGVSLGAGSVMSGSRGVISGVTGITNTMGTIYQHSLIPNQARGNTNVGDYSFSMGLTQLIFKRISIKNEMATKIDQYFDMFGYKVCNVKVPNITGRTYWNYIKTIDCNCDGDIPQEDLDTIRKACNNGITFWHSPSNIYNYSLSNTIV